MIIIAKRQALISAVKPILDDLIITAEFGVAEQLYFRILQDVGE